MDAIAEIDNQFYECIIKGDKCTVFSFVSENDADFIGVYMIINNKLVEYFPMSDTYAEVGIVYLLQ